MSLLRADTCQDGGDVDIDGCLWVKGNTRDLRHAGIHEAVT
jgi:hypothetical protein